MCIRDSFRFPARNPRRHTALSFYQPHYLFRQNKNIKLHLKSHYFNTDIQTYRMHYILQTNFRYFASFKHRPLSDHCQTSSAFCTNVILSFSLWSCQIYVQYAHSTKFSIQFICISHCLCILICLFIKSEMTKRGDRISPLGGPSSWWVRLAQHAASYLALNLISSFIILQ